MNVIEFDTEELSPWADINLCLNNMRTLTVKVGGQEYVGRATLKEENGEVTIEFPAKRGRPKAE